MSSYTGLEIAIIGMSGRFPDAPDLATFWQNLAGGVESIHHFDVEELTAEGLDRTLVERPDYVPAKGDIADAEAFDAEFFGVSPREAQITDPQQRLFLEHAWQAFEDAGHDPARFDGLIGVYAGASMNRYQLDLHADPEVMAAADAYQLMLGNDKDFLTTRVSYKLGLEGPSVAVQTACSTSLVAVHMAVQALNSGECDLALAGGASVRLPRKEGYLYREGMILSPDGHCRAFDTDAAGTVEGNGLGIVVLRRLEDALAAGDTIRAVIKGTAINNDGAQKVGFTAPRVQGQARAIRAAQMVAEVDADSIGYVEAHGTATPLGDSIEVSALTRAFRATTEAAGFCALGSVKTNIGHLDAAAGVAGLIKTVLALEAKQIPPSLHYTKPPEGIDFASSPFFVNTELREWTSDGPRRAGVSSFGIGGTNAHVILEEAPVPAPRQASSGRHLLVLSARSRDAVEAQSQQLAAYLDARSDLALRDVAATLQHGRRAFDHRRALVGASLDEAVSQWRDASGSGLLDGMAEERDGAAFLFPGQGAQYLAMGQALRQDAPGFATPFDRCREILRPRLGVDLLDVQAEDIHQTSFAQPYLVAVETSLAALWRSWGIEPRALLGHSLGELSAACVAGVFSLETALELAVLRGRWMQEQPAGAMTSVLLSDEAIRPLLEDGLTLAALNVPASETDGTARSVVSGPIETMAALEERLQSEGHTCKRLRTSHAFHSPMMAPVAEALTAHLRTVRLEAPSLPFVSNLTGTWIEPSQATDPNYWAEQMLAPVRFADGLATLAETALPLLEVGPGRQLSGFARRHPAIASSRLVVSSLGGANEAALEDARVLAAAGKLWCGGFELDWQALTAPDSTRRVPLPTYPFERQNYGLTRRVGSLEEHLAAPTRSGPSIPSNPLATPAATAGEDGEYFYVPSWRQAPPRPRSSAPITAPSLVFVDDSGLGERLAERLEHAGAWVCRVRAGRGFERRDATHFVIDPECADDFEALFTALAEDAFQPALIVHAWTVADDAALDPASRIELAERLGFHAALHLARALGRLPAADRRLVFLTSHMQRIAGELAAAPEKAVLLGPGLVIPQEFPGMICQILDLAPQGGPEGLQIDEDTLDALLSEIRAEDPEPVAAFRDGVRWLRDFTPLPTDPLDAPTSIERDGTYLITGGLGEMGLTFAESLVDQGARQLVLLSRSGLEDLSTDTASPPEPLRETLHRLAVEVTREIDLVRLDDHAGFEDGLRQLSARYAADYLRSSGLDLGEPQPEDALRHALGVIPEYDRFFDYLLGLLEQDGALLRGADGLTVRPDEGPSAAERLKALEARHPDFGGLLELLAHCARHLYPALSGEIPGIGVLYPGGEATLLERTGRNSLAYGHRPLYAALLGERIARRAAAEPDRTIRVLEVGGGTGILTWTVIQRLASRNIEHHFTDIGPAFVHKAKEQAAAQGLDFLRFGTLDIRADPLAQGYAAESFDFVIGLDVVHAAPSIPRAVEHLKTLLVPGGEMLLVERVEPYPWVQLIWGLAKDWWIFEDGKRQDQPLIPTQTWCDILTEAGLVEVHGLDRDDVTNPASHGADYALLAARKPAPVETLTATRQDRRAPQRRRVEALEAKGAEVLTVCADVSDRDAMAEAFAAIRERFPGPICGVIHAAGVLGMGMIQRKNLADTEAVLAPKLRGTHSLEEHLFEEPLDFFVLCSSLSGLAGNVGQVDYCAANAFLDAYAHFAHRPLRSGPTPRKRRLPVLSVDWARWRDAGMAVEAMPPDDGGRPVDHPLLQRCLHETPNRVLFRAQLGAADCWALNEHRLAGHPVLPGTAYLEMARAAFDIWKRAEHGIELRDVLFWTPLVQPDDEPREVFTVLETSPRGVHFQVLSRAPRSVTVDGFVRHATGQIHRLSAKDSPNGDLAARLARLEQADAVTPEDRGLDGFGPRWHVLKRSHFGDGEALGVLELDAAFDGDREHFRLHPSLLDAATSFAAGRLMPSFQFPLSYDRIRLLGSLPRHVRSLARWRHDEGQWIDGERLFTTDIVVFDEAGQPLVTVEGFTKRGIDMEKHRAAQEAGIASSAQLLDVPANAILGADALPELRPPSTGDGFRSAQGRRVLERLLHRNDLAQVAVSTHPLGAAHQATDTTTAAEGNAAEAATAHTAPPSGSSLTDTLQRVWGEVLGLDQVATGDNFFELGGDSILALQLVTRAKEVGLELHPGLIFQHQTIAELARALGAEDGTDDRMNGSSESAESAESADTNSDHGSDLASTAPKTVAPSGEETPWKDFPLANLDARSFGQLAEQIDAFDALDEDL